MGRRSWARTGRWSCARRCDGLARAYPVAGTSLAGAGGEWIVDLGEVPETAARDAPAEFAPEELELWATMAQMPSRRRATCNRRLGEWVPIDAHGLSSYFGGNSQYQAATAAKAALQHCCRIAVRGTLEKQAIGGRVPCEPNSHDGALTLADG